MGTLTGKVIYMKNGIAFTFERKIWKKVEIRFQSIEKIIDYFFKQVRPHSTVEFLSASRTVFNKVEYARYKNAEFKEAETSSSNRIMKF